MSFLDEDDDAMHAFEAALSFVDAFALDEAAADSTAASDAATARRSSDHQLATLSLSAANPIERDSSVAAPTTTNPSRSQMQLMGGSTGTAATFQTVQEAVRSRRRVAENARKRMLRKAGVYGNPNRARNERRLEIAYLREKVGELELELEQLKTRSGHEEAETTEVGETTNGARPLPDSEQQDAEVQALGVWRDVAARQKARREKTERENVRLKLIVESQLKVAKSLETLLIKRAQQQTAECSSIMPTNLSPSRTVDIHADPADFQTLLEYLDSAYREVDALLESNGLATMELTQQDVHMREGANGMCLEVFSNKVMPFGLRATAEATWNHMKGSKKHRGNLYAKAAQNLDSPYTIIEHFSKELFAGNSSTDVRAKQIVRRYVEAEREVIVWVATLTPVEIKRKAFQPFTGLTTHHRNFAIIKRARASTPARELSLLQLISLVDLGMTEGTIYDPTFVRALTDFLLSNAARNIKADQELIENVLMDHNLQT